MNSTPVKQTIVLVHGAYADSSSWNGSVNALRKDHTSSRNPVGLVTVDHVADDVVRSPVIAVARRHSEPVGKMREPRRQRARRGTEQLQ